MLCTRGSLELGDICTDLAAAPDDFEFGGGLGKCKVHQVGGACVFMGTVQQGRRGLLEGGTVLRAHSSTVARADDAKHHFNVQAHRHMSHGSTTRAIDH